MFKEFIERLSNKFSIRPTKIGESIQNQRQSKVKFKDVLKQLHSNDLANFLWLSILKPERKFNAHTLMILRQISLKEAKESLILLFRKNLLIKCNHSSEYYVHESLRAFSYHLLTSNNSNESGLIRLGIKWKDAHQKSILSFQNCNNIITKNQDIYFLDNLDWHLEEAGWNDQIHAIISNTFPLHQWSKKLSTDMIDCNLETVKLLSIAENDSELNFLKNPRENLLLLTKYKLLQNTQAYAIQNIPAEWVKVLVTTKQWSEKKAMAYIQTQANSERKSHCIESLIDSISDQYIKSLLEIIAETKLDSARVQAIKSIFIRLDNPSKKRALSLISELKTESYQAIGLSSISSHIPIPLMHKVFTLIQAIQDEALKATALESYLPHFTKPLKRKSLEIIQSLENKNTRFRLLSRLKESIPQAKIELINLASEVKADYTKLSVLWSLLERKEQSSDKIIEFLGTCDSALDKMLFLSDLIQDCSEPQRQELWAIASNFEDEFLWSNSMAELIPYLDPAQINILIKQVSNLKSEDLKGELCIHIFPFASHPEEYDELHQVIQNIKDLEIRASKASQILDYIPSGFSTVLNSFSEIDDPIKQLEIQINLLENEVELEEPILKSITKLKDEAIKTQFISQIIYLIPNQDIPAVVDLAFELKQAKNRDSILNQLTPRLDIHEIKHIIGRLTLETYPTSIFKNVSKQINRNYWESGLPSAHSNLPPEMLEQLSRTPMMTTKNNTEEILEEIFNLPGNSNQSKILSMYLNEIQWNNLQPETLRKIMMILSQGSSLELLKNLPTLTQGIETIMGAQSLPAYGNICDQLSQGNIFPQTPILQNTDHTFHKAESQEFWPEIA